MCERPLRAPVHSHAVKANVQGQCSPSASGSSNSGQAVTCRCHGQLLAGQSLAVRPAVAVQGLVPVPTAWEVDVILLEISFEVQKQMLVPPHQASRHPTGDEWLWCLGIASSGSHLHSPPTSPSCSNSRRARQESVQISGQESGSLALHSSSSNGFASSSSFQSHSSQVRPIAKQQLIAGTSEACAAGSQQRLPQLQLTSVFGSVERTVTLQHAWSCLRLGSKHLAALQSMAEKL
jgi:hypothetical protein